MNAELEEKIKGILPFLPTQPPESIAKLAQERKIVEGDGFAFKVAYASAPNGKKVKMVQVTCSACGKSELYDYAPLESPGDTNRVCGYASSYYGKFGFISYQFSSDGEVRKNGSDFVCPNCASCGSAYHVSHLPTYVDNGCMATVHEISGYPVFLTWVIRRYLTKEGTIQHSLHGYDGFAIIGGKMVTLRKYEKYMTSTRILPEWKYLRTLRYDFGAVQKKNFITPPEEIEQMSCLKKSGIAYYLENDGKKVQEYVSLWLKYPQAENLVRTGFVPLLDDILQKFETPYGVSRCGLLNLKEKKPYRMLGITRNESFLRRYQLQPFKLFLMARDAGVTINEEDLIFLLRSGTYALGKVLREYEVKPRKLITYAIEQMKKNERATLIELEDYWRALTYLHGKVPEALRYPENLPRAHDDATAKMKSVKSERITEGFKQQYEKYKEFEYHKDGLMIRPCKTQDELAREGETLCHCVATYAERHSKDECCIFFIRQDDKPEAPYYTLELVNCEIRQNRGKNNCGVTKEIKFFGEAWIKYLKRKVNKNDRKRRDQAAVCGA